jgi:hypothetical protein
MATQIQVRQTNQASSKFQCAHKTQAPDGSEIGDCLVGDAHLLSCNFCGAYYPNSGSAVIRAVKRHTQLYKLHTSDILRTLYSQCQRKGNKPELALKVSPQYQEVRNLIIDWLVEVSETLHLDMQKSAYHAIIILDRFLSAGIRKFKKDMDQSLIML